MPAAGVIKGGRSAGATDEAVDQTITRKLSRRAGMSDEEFLKSANITGDLEQSPDAPGYVPAGTPKTGGIVDGVDKATQYGWNAQFAIPAVGGVAGWIATKGKSLGPVYGAPLRAAGTLLGAPQKAMTMEVQDLAHFGSGKLFRDAQSHVDAADFHHGRALRDLEKAEQALKGDGYASLRAQLAEARRSYGEAHAVMPKDLTPLEAREWQMSGNAFPAEKALALDHVPAKTAFESAAAEIRGTTGAAGGKAVTVRKAELKALEKAQTHMNSFAHHAGEVQKHIIEVEPIHQRAMAAKVTEDVKRDALIGSAERKLDGLAAKTDEVVAKSGPLNAVRGWAEKRFSASAARHAAKAAAKQAEAMKRFDRTLAAIPQDARFDELRGIVEGARAGFGELPATTNKTALEGIAKKFAAAEKAFNDASSALVKSGNLSAPEKTALTQVKKSFSGKFFGFGGVSKALGGAHGPLEAQGAAEAKAAFTKDLKAGVSSIPKALSKVNGEQIFNKSLYWGSQGVAVIRSGQVTGTGFGQFKEISADMQGVDHKKVSNVTTAMQLLHLAPVEAPMKEARRQFWMSVGPRVLGNAAGMVAFKKMMERGAGGAAMGIGIAVQMGSSIGGEAIGSRNQLLDAYHQVAQAQKQGPVDKGAYIGLIVHAHKADKLNLQDKRILSVADDYVKENISAAGVLKEISSGRFDQRLAAASVPKEAAPAQAPAPQAELAQTMSARDRLQGAGAEQTVVGSHTLKEKLRRTNEAVAGASQATSAALS